MHRLHTQLLKPLICRYYEFSLVSTRSEWTVVCLRQAEIQTNEDGSVSSFRDRFLSGRTNDLSCLPHARSGSCHAASGQDFKGCWLLHKYELAVVSVRRVIPSGCASSRPCFPEPPILYAFAGDVSIATSVAEPRSPSLPQPSSSRTEYGWACRLPIITTVVSISFNIL